MIILEWSEWLVIPLFLIILIAARVYLGQGEKSPWPNNKDLVRDCLAAITAGLAVSAFIRGRLNDIALRIEPAFEYSCSWTDRKLTVTQVTAQPLRNTPYLFIDPEIVDGNQNNPVDPMLTNILSKKQLSLSLNLHPSVPDPYDLTDRLDEGYPGILTWLNEHKGSRVKAITAYVSYGPTSGDEPTSPPLTRRCQ